MSMRCLLMSTSLVALLSSIGVSFAEGGVDLGSMAFNAVECPIESKPALMIVEGDNEKPEQYERYTKALLASGIYEKLGAYYVTVGGPKEVFEGEWAEQKFMAVVRFPCLARAQQFWYSDTYKALKPLRAGAGDVRSLLFEEFAVPERVGWLD